MFLQEPSCISYSYYLIGKMNETGPGFAIGTVNRNIRTKIHPDNKWREAQISVPANQELNELLISLPRIPKNRNSKLAIDNVTVTLGQCQPLDCSPNEFQCEGSCLSNFHKCDGVIDCENTLQDELDCDFSFTNNFEDEKRIYYAEVVDMHEDGDIHAHKAQLVTSHGEILDHTYHNGTGHFLQWTCHEVTDIPDYVCNMVFMSPLVEVTQNICVKFYYLVTGSPQGGLYVGKFEQDHSLKTLKTMKEFLRVSMKMTWLPLQFEVEPGSIMFYIGLRASENETLALDDVKSYAAPCGLLDCPEGFVECRGDNFCYAIEDGCDGIEHCPSGFDEINGCDKSIACDFDDSFICGYKNGSNSTHYWVPVPRPAKIPTDDIMYQMFQENRGQLMIFTTRGPGIFGQRGLLSPTLEIKAQSCVSFDYFFMVDSLRGYDIVVNSVVDGVAIKKWTLIDRNGTQSWKQGHFEVSPGRQSIEIIGMESFTVSWNTRLYTIAVDNVTVTNGECPIPVCLDTQFVCDKQCFPNFYKCDGVMDCSNGIDEAMETCTDMEDGQIRLVGQTPGSGLLQMSYNHTWGTICDDAWTEMNTNVTCHQLGYTGRHERIRNDAYFLGRNNILFENVRCTGLEDNLLSCRKSPLNQHDCTNIEDVAIACTNSTCEPGMFLCPGEVPFHMCIENKYVCDGRDDCPYIGRRAGDETNCEAVKGTCDPSEYQCKDYSCVSGRRCDGNVDCVDGSDEHNCVRSGDDGFVEIEVDGSFLKICSDDMTESLSNILCSITGQGSMVTYYSAESESNGFHLQYTGKRSLQDVIENPHKLYSTYSTYKRQCKPMKLVCLSPDCGHPKLTRGFDPVVLYGRKTWLGKNPWQIALFFNSPNLRFTCGGTIIHPSWIITAAHCVERGNDYKIVAGIVNRTMNARDHGQKIEVSRTFMHPNYSRSSLLDDIALIELSVPLKFNNYVQPACLPMREYNISDKCLITGWGRNEKGVNPIELQELRVEIGPRSDCYHSRLPVTPESDHNVYCVGNDNPGSPVCYGDSGGPMVCQNSAGRWELTGVASFTIPGCMEPISPGGFTKVISYLDWIKEVSSFDTLAMQQNQTAPP